MIRVTGETRPIGGRGFIVAFWRRIGRGSDRGIVLLNPGNAGGGKAPDFWDAFDEGEEGVIGDEP